MKKERVKQILSAAGKLPAAKGRALVAAVCAKDAPADAREADMEEYLEQAAGAMAAAMEAALIQALEETLL